MIAQALNAGGIYSFLSGLDLDGHALLFARDLATGHFLAVGAEEGHLAIAFPAGGPHVAVRGEGEGAAVGVVEVDGAKGADEVPGIAEAG